MLPQRKRKPRTREIDPLASPATQEVATKIPSAEVVLEFRIKEIRARGDNYSEVFAQCLGNTSGLGQSYFDQRCLLKYAGYLPNVNTKIIAQVAPGKDLAGRTFFSIKSYQIPGINPEDLHLYLANSNLFKGIGPEVARRLSSPEIRNEFESLLLKDPARLAEISNVRPAIISTLQDTWKANEGKHYTAARLFALNLTDNQVGKLIEAYGPAAYDRLINSPYTINVEGWAWETIDRVARCIGVIKTDPRRIDAGVLWALDAAMRVDGHTSLTLDSIYKAAEQLLKLDANTKVTIEKGIARLLSSGELKEYRERVANEPGAGVVWYIGGTQYITESNTWANLTSFEPRVSVLTSDELSAVDRYLDELDIKLNSEQREAVKNAFNYRVSCVIGPAGTGKTTIIKAIKEVAARLAGNRIPASIQCVAFSGKAAARIRAVSQIADSRTVHGALGLGYAFGVARQTSVARQTITVDILIIDEAAMLDVILFAKLIKAIDFRFTRVVLLGDPYQLPPIDPGQPFQDLLNCQRFPVVELVQVVRQTGALQNNALKILNGVLEHKDDSGWQAKELARHPPDRTDQILQTFKTLIERETGAYSPEDIVILSPTNKDPNVGTTALNEAIKGYLFPGDNSQFPLGLKVINRKNSELQNSNGEVVQVMNGEIGYVDSLLPADGFDDKGDPLFDVVVKFEDGRFAIFPFGRNLATAYALTVHKAQGSEFPVVIFICDGFNLNQGMAYTALTRAQKGATVYWGSHWWRIKQPRVDRRSLFGYLSQNGIEVNNYA